MLANEFGHLGCYEHGIVFPHQLVVQTHRIILFFSRGWRSAKKAVVGFVFRAVIASVLYHVVVRYFAVSDTVLSGVEAPAGGL